MDQDQKQAINYFLNVIEQFRRMFFVETAQSEALEHIGLLYGIKRFANESDEFLRKKIFHQINLNNRRDLDFDTPGIGASSKLDGFEE
jgi:hypothetical protein